MSFKRAWKRASLLVLSIAEASCGGTTREEALEQLSRVMTEAKACSTSSQCVLAGQSNCSCAAPVNASFLPRIDAAVSEVNRTCAAADFLGDCLAYQNPRCEQGQCVADPR
jgi:hypothetical protein